jgi:hypothetical protein
MAISPVTSSPASRRNSLLFSPTAPQRGRASTLNNGNGNENGRPSPLAKSFTDGPPPPKQDPNEVRDVKCVAFGAFDRYYMSWTDKEGKYYQGKLPSSLGFFKYLVRNYS